MESQRDSEPRSVRLRPSTRGAILAVALLLLVAALGWLTGRPSPSRLSPLPQQGPTETAPTYYHDPIETEGEAYLVAGRYVPNGVVFDEEFARLVTMQIADDWRGVDGFYTHENPQTPVWIVALLGDGLTVADILPDWEGFNASVEPVEGAFYMFDANSAARIGWGALESDSPQNETTLRALQNMALPIVPATEAPPLPSSPPTVPGSPTVTPVGHEYIP